MDIRQDNDATLQELGWRYNPFVSGGGFHFYKPKRRAVLEELIHFSRYSRLVLAVTGPWGSGKTVLRHAVEAVSKENIVNVAVSALRHGDAAGLIQQLGHALPVGVADVMGFLSAVEQLAQNGKSLQLLIDDAEALDASAFLLVQRLVREEAGDRCTVILFGEPGLQPLLRAAQQSEGLEYHLLELEPWSGEEVEGYLQLCLQGAGCDLDLFTDRELAILLEQSQGWPGVVNQRAQELLLARLKGTISLLVPSVLKKDVPLLSHWLLCWLCKLFVFCL